jgi:hypothetical protein
MSELKLGDVVQWSSTSGGNTKKKVGIIVYEVAPSQTPATYPDRKLNQKIHDTLQRLGMKFSTDHLGGGCRRNEKSYLIAVPGKLNKSCFKLYWPRVSWIEKTDEIPQNLSNLPWVSKLHE